MRKLKLLFDTNFLVYLAKEKKLRFLEELIKSYNIYLIDKSLNELKKLERGRFGYRIKLLSEFLEEIIKKKKIFLIKARYEVDKEILERVNDFDLVATYDKKLIKLLKEKNPKLKIFQKKF